MSHAETAIRAAQGRGLAWSICLVVVVSLSIGAAINWGAPFFHALYEAAGSIFVGMT